MATPYLSYYSPNQANAVLEPQSGGLAQPDSIGNPYDNGVPAVRVGRQGTLTLTTGGMADGWLRFEGVHGRCDALAPFLTLSGPTTDLLRVSCATTDNFGNSDWRFEYYDGASWVQIGTDFAASGSDVDIHWHIDGAAGEFEIYVNGVLSQSVTGDTLHTADTTIDTIVFTGSDNSNVFSYASIFGNIFIDTADTRGLYFAVMIPTSDGFHSGFGPETNVDNYPHETNGEVTSNPIGSAGLQQTYNMSAIDAGLSGGTVETVIVGIWGKAISEPSLYLKPLLRKSSTDYTPAGSTLVWSRDDAFFGIQMDVDPSTGSAWANAAAVEAFEYGLSSSATP